MPRPTTPQDVVVNNGWYLELPGLISPHFETLEGVAKSTGTVGIVDAGVNRETKFSSQVVRFNDMTLTRARQNNADDITLEAVVDQCIDFGLKIPVVAVKLHNGRPISRIVFKGFRFVTRTYPTHDINGEEKFIMAYTATCDGHTELPL